MGLDTIFSLIFYFTFAIYFSFAIYILIINPKHKLNISFFMVCLSLCIWAFSFAFANNANTMEEALFWRKTASLGWGTIYPILFHFILILTKRDQIRKRILFPLLYIPALSIVLIFGLVTPLANAQFNLVDTEAGWINDAHNGFVDMYFYLYYVVFSVLTLFFLFKSFIKEENQIIKKQLSVIFYFTLLALSIGTITEFIITKTLPGKIPQMAPIIILIPIFAIFILIKKYHFMKPSKGQVKVDKGRILSENDTFNIYLSIGMFFVFAGITNFAIEYFVNQNAFLDSLLFNILLLLLGIVILVLRFLSNRKVMEIIFIFIAFVFIIVLNIRYIINGNITLWAISLLLIILSVIYIKKFFLISISLAFLISTLMTWILYPNINVNISSDDYIVRILIFVITVLLAILINRIYIKRIRENESQVFFQKTLSKISSGFVNLNEENLEVKIYLLLRECCKYLGVETSTFLTTSKKYKNYYYSRNDNSRIKYEKIQTKDWIDYIEKRKIISFNQIDKLPNILAFNDITSGIISQVNYGKDVIGLLYFLSKKDIIWQDNHFELLKIVTNLLNEALIQLESEKKLNYMAYYDPLTNLVNGVFFKEKLCDKINSSNDEFAVCFLDIDNFKTVNDVVGHIYGDDVLKEIAKRIKSTLSNNDLLARFNSDEFLILLNREQNRIDEVLKKIMDIFDSPFKILEHEFFMSASIGVALYPIDGMDADSLLKNADLAMYYTKFNGKNSYNICTDKMKNDVKNKLKMSNLLHKAIENSELYLNYQPQINVITNEIIGIEALLRWNNPTLGLVPPSVFIPIAEQNGMIIEIGKWVIKTACEQNKKWQDMGFKPIRVAINLSAIELRNPNLLSYLKEFIKNYSIDPKYIELEITESAAIKNKEYIIKVTSELRNLGFTIAIDDFGTEYSSFTQLRNLDINRIKIDMQFIRGLFDNKKDEAITQTIIQLGKKLHIDVIAEGVETKEQADYLIKHICHEIQGYYYYRPMDKDQIEKLLKKN